MPTHRVEALNSDERNTLVDHEAERLRVPIHISTTEPLRRRDHQRDELPLLLPSAQPHHTGNRWTDL